MSKPKSSSGFLKLFDVKLEASIVFITQVYSDSTHDARESAINELYDLIGGAIGSIRIDKTIVVEHEEKE